MSSHSPTVAVVGLGATGSMTLWNLAQRGVQVTGFERGQPGDDDGAYGGRTRQFRLVTHDRHTLRHEQLARRSLTLWRKLEADTGVALYLQTGQLGVGPAVDPDIAGLRAAVQSAGHAHDVLTADEVSNRFPAHALSAGEIGIYVHDAGVLRSNLAVATAVEAARGLGATVRAQSAVTKLESAGKQVTLTVGGERLQFDRVVLTAGPWTAELVPELRSVVTARAIVSAWHETAVAGVTAPDVFPPGFRRSEPAGNAYTFLPALDGECAKVIYWIPLRPEVMDTVAWRQNPAEVDLRAARRALTATLPGVKPEPSTVTVYLEGFTADRFPIISRATENVTVLAGFSGMGFAVSPMMGEMAAQLALGEEPRFDAASLSPKRLIQDAMELPAGGA